MRESIVREHVMRGSVGESEKTNYSLLVLVIEYAFIDLYAHEGKQNKGIFS
jgi:hypothetical protein